MRFSINLATRTHLDRRLLNNVSLLVITMLIALLGLNVARILQNLAEEKRLVSEIRSLEGNLNTRPDGVSEKDYDIFKSRIRFYNEIIDRKSTAWLKLLELVENSTPDGVSLVSLTPAKKNGELKLEGRARSFAVVRQYLEKLEESKAFSDVMLLSHQEMTVGENGRGVQFSISCKVQF